MLFASLIGAAPAAADDAPRVIPLVTTSEIPTDLHDLGPSLTAALAEMLDGDATKSSLAQLGKKLRCDIDMSQCLDSIAAALKTSQLAYGEFSVISSHKVKVKLFRFDSAAGGSELQRRTFVISAPTAQELGKALARQAAPMFDRPEPEEPIAKSPPGGSPPAPPPGGREELPLPPRTDERAPGITNSTWAMIGSGAVVGAVGVGFLLSARGLRGEIADAPRATLLDLRRLESLERTGRTRLQIGGVLTVAGGAALSVGVVRAILQRDTKRRPPERDLAVVPISGGAAVVFTARGLL